MDYFMHADGSPISLQGYAALFNIPTDDPIQRYGNRRVIVKPSAFDATLRCPHPVVMNMSHIAAGRIDGELSLWCDSVGLGFEMKNIRPVSAGPNAVRLISRGELNGVSWGSESEETEETTFDGERVIAITEVHNLDHVSPCATPAFSSTGVWLSTATTLNRHLSALRDAWDGSRRRMRVQQAASRDLREIVLPADVLAALKGPSTYELRSKFLIDREAQMPEFFRRCLGARGLIC